MIAAYNLTYMYGPTCGLRTLCNFDRMLQRMNFFVYYVERRNVSKQHICKDQRTLGQGT